MSRFLRVALCAVVSLHAQVWVRVPKRTATYRSFPRQPAPLSPDYPFYLTVPASTGSFIDTMCRAESSPYEWWRWLAGDPVSPSPTRIWVGPSREFRRDPSMLYLTGERPMRGLEFTGAFAGAIAANTDPDRTNPKSAITQAFFAHARPCYDGGAEIGFYRRLAKPSETGSLLFYYSDVNNCTGRAGGYRDGRLVEQTSCRVKADGSFVSQSETPMTPVPIPAAKNSKGGRDWTYRAWAATATKLRVEVRDPYSNALAWSADVPVAAFFLPYARQMLAGRFRASLTLTIQKTLDRDVRLRNRGDVLPDPRNPPVIEVRTIAVGQ